MECSIGYFTFDSIDSLSETIEEFQAEPTQSTTGKALVTADQFEELKQQVKALQ
jgi:hypothetical protein